MIPNESSSEGPDFVCPASREADFPLSARFELDMLLRSLSQNLMQRMTEQSADGGQR